MSTRTPSLLLLPGHAIACDDAFSVHESPAIHVENGAISYIGPRDLAPPFQPEETIESAHLVALPGLVNAHTHTAMTLMRGWADDMALEPWLQTKIWPFESHLCEEDVAVGTRLALLEMLRGGTTLVADMYFFYERGAREMAQSGIRACPGGVFLGFLPEPERRLEQAIAFARDWQGEGEGRITPFLGPHSLYTVGREHWERIVAAAREHNLLIHTHVAETPREVADVRQQWGQTPVQVLAEMGALDGPLLAAHGVYLSDEEHEVVAGQRDAQGYTRFRVAHNPTSNCKLASGFAPIPRYLQNGVTVALGPDGAASNNDLDMWEEMRLAALLHKATTGDATVVSARQALWMATRDGARALNLGDKTGTLEAGKRADIVLVDFDKPHLSPCHSVASHLVYAAKASDVDTVLIDGRVVVRAGEATTLEAAQVLREARECAARLGKLASANVPES
jgi:5-methylthioadenosine/S-adenosylhomocysteine deaminase